MLSLIETDRLQISKNTDSNKKAELGQFFTSEKTAQFMASLFPNASGYCHLLDAGAGIGSLSIAFLERWKNGQFRFKTVELDAFEIDESLHSYLSKNLDTYSENCNFIANLLTEDFIYFAVDSLSNDLFSRPLRKYTHAILNPPYKKINSHSTYRLGLRRVGIETVNLYSAFVALAVALSEINGQIVAIIPRSFCNGPYYRQFRDFILERTAIRHIHLFESRNKAFKDDAVLQENIIIRLERGVEQGPVSVSISTDDSFNDLVINEYPFEYVVFPDNPDHFIHIPSSPEIYTSNVPTKIKYSLDDLGIKVSTGPVVDFRLKNYLRDMPESGTVPLLYPCHFSGQKLTWPIKGKKKPNAIVRNVETEKWLYPNGYYCVVRRFSSKEERRRIVASVVDPIAFGNIQLIGFENHLNIFHSNKSGLSEPLARGLAVYLNTTFVDINFRHFNGHTQVNATDLRLIKYPSHKVLIELGLWAMQQKLLTQPMIDAKVDDFTK